MKFLKSLDILDPQTKAAIDKCKKPTKHGWFSTKNPPRDIKEYKNFISWVKNNEPELYECGCKLK